MGVQEGRRTGLEDGCLHGFGKIACGRRRKGKEEGKISTQAARLESIYGYQGAFSIQSAAPSGRGSHGKWDHLFIDVAKDARGGVCERRSVRHWIAICRRQHADTAVGLTPMDDPWPDGGGKGMPRKGAGRSSAAPDAWKSPATGRKGGTTHGSTGRPLRYHRRGHWIGALLVRIMGDRLEGWVA
jgi:hypothetical protein